MTLREVFSFLEKVKGSSKFDPCFTPATEVEEQLKSFVVGDDNKLDGFLNKGEVSQAAQLALSVLKAANAKPLCGQGLSSLTKILVRTFYFIRVTHGLTR